MPGRGSPQGRHVPGHLPGWMLWPSICSPAPRTTCSLMAGSVGSGAARPCPVPACVRLSRVARVPPQPGVRFINTTGSGRCRLRSRLGVQISLYWVSNDQGCLAFAPLRGRVVLCHLQEEENQEKKAVAQVFARLGGCPSPGGAHVPRSGFARGPDVQTKELGACSQGSDRCDPFIASFSSLPVPLRRRRLLGEPKGDGELGEPSLEAQPHGGKKQLTGVRGWCFPPGGQFAGLQPLRVFLPTRTAVPGPAAAAQDVG